MAKLSIASVLHSGVSEKSELQDKVNKLIGANFTWRPNSRISCRVLQAVIDLSEYKRNGLLDENEVRALSGCDKATKVAVFSAVLDELRITDLSERQAFMRIPVATSEDSFVSQVLGMFV